MTRLAIEKIRVDGGTQPRAALDPETIASYADAIHDGAALPPPVVFFDGEAYWLADGFHRFHALGKLGRHHVECDVRQGTRRDAVLFSVGANATHGKPRTNADKRRAVETLLHDQDWRKWSDHDIADRCAVTQPFVSKVRAEVSTNNGYQSEPERRGRDGRTINVSKIGKPEAPRQLAIAERAPEPPPRPAPPPPPPEPSPEEEDGEAPPSSRQPAPVPRIGEQRDRFYDFTETEVRDWLLHAADNATRTRIAHFAATLIEKQVA